jgi:hypothetical protein
VSPGDKSVSMATKVSLGRRKCFKGDERVSREPKMFIVRRKCFSISLASTVSLLRQSVSMTLKCHEITMTFLRNITLRDTKKMYPIKILHWKLTARVRESGRRAETHTKRQATQHGCLSTFSVQLAAQWGVGTKD